MEEVCNVERTCEHIGRHQIAQVMVNKGVAQDIDAAFDHQIGNFSPYYIPSTTYVRYAPMEKITLVRGDSATGKTYLYQILEDVKLLPQYQDIKLFNYKSDNFHEELAKCRNKFIVIDNADILLTTGAGLHYWKLVNHYLLSDEYMVESKLSNQGLLDAVREIDSSDNNLYFIAFDIVYDNMDIMNKYLELSALAKNSKGKIRLIDLTCFEYIILTFTELIHWTECGRKDKIAV